MIYKYKHSVFLSLKNRMDFRRGSQKCQILCISVLLVVGLSSLKAGAYRRSLNSEPFRYRSTTCRSHTASLEDFGAVGDGETSNTAAFQAAVDHLSQFAGDGGAQLYVPPGKWVTGCFNLTSNFTLYLHREATILGSQDMNEWPIIDPLPSYGRGRDLPGGRYCNLISGSNLTDVVITGDNGTIDGQGQMWWEKFIKKELEHTRGYLIEIMYSDQILISSITLLNSPSWHLHPVYSSNIIVKDVTILAPVEIKNTDGINPDSCSNVKIEDCYIVSGDDCIAVKSGWDQYGIAVGIPTQHIIIRRLTCISPSSAVIALGSEMSGGILDVRADDILALDSESGIRVKTAVGRGGFVKNIYARNLRMKTMRWAFWMTGSYGSHPDEGWDRNAIPVVEGINFRDVAGENVSVAGQLEGLEESHFKGICVSNVTIEVAANAKKKKVVEPWNCTDVEGVSRSVNPAACSLLVGEEGGEPCPFPEDRLAIDDVEFVDCSI